MYTSKINLYKSACEVRWYMANDVIDYLYRIRDFVIYTNCKLSATLVPRLTPVPANMLFGPEYRFPQSKLFICEGIGQWNYRLQQIQLLTSIITNTNRLQRQYKNIHTMADAETKLLDHINDAIHEFETGVDLVDRIVFEQRYQLIWDEDYNPDERPSCGQRPVYPQDQPQPTTTTDSAAAVIDVVVTAGSPHPSSTKPDHVTSHISAEEEQ